jgi:hypothetical protein
MRSGNVYTYIERFEEGLADPGKGGGHPHIYIPHTQLNLVTYPYAPNMPYTPHINVLSNVMSPITTNCHTSY